ncbi:MAG: carboxypeptidase-like regulatory domain-containing protein [Candidatus Gracilibacteria bacterium]|nr:carboxypeptidase-like regulatory domain-containing protein [Candidatus Gracilibacteria bacterium]
MNRKIFLLFAVIISLGAITFLINNFNNNSNVDDNTLNKIEIKKYEDNLYSNVLNKENYDKVGINPEKYATYEDFLKDFKTFEGMKLDPTKEDFVISYKDEGGKETFTAYRLDEIKKGKLLEGKRKDKAILDIYKAYKNGNIYGGYNSNQADKIVFREDIGHEETKTLDSILAGKNNINDVKKELENIENLDTSKKELLAYINDLEGNYEHANKQRENLCKDDPNTCRKMVNFTFVGTVLDSDKTPISNVEVVYLNDSDKTSKTNEKGEFEIKLKLYNFSHARFKAKKIGYSDSFMVFSVNSYKDDTWNNEYRETFVMNKAGQKEEINLVEERKKEGKFFTLETQKSKYFIPKDGLKTFSGEEYKGDKLDVYLHEFTKTSDIETLLNNDIFSNEVGYSGNVMVTYGMPYIQFFNPENKEELFIMSSNPMILQHRNEYVEHMKKVDDTGNGLLTNEDIKFLVEKSNELGGYPIDTSFLRENNLLKWPLWWTLDREKGIWYNCPHRVIDETGMVALEFYSIKDN